MGATFQSLRDTRLPKALRAVGLLSNLTRYDHAEHEAKVLVNDLLDAVDEVDAAFATKWGWPDTAEAVVREPVEIPVNDTTYLTGAYIERKVDVHVPIGVAEGGASFESEVRWALDCLKRGDAKTAENRLQRILGGE